MLLRRREALIVKQAQKEGQSARRTQMGNYPVIDLMVVSPKGVPFLIYVNAQYKRNHRLLTLGFP